jgi:large subunit ribosomal protein L3
MVGIIGRKIGMTSLYDKKGNNVACTIIEAGPCVITQVKTNETDGYTAVQMGFADKREKRSNKAEINHFKKANTLPKYKTVELRDFENPELGKTITADIFVEGDYIDVIGTSKGKGFQGVVKRHGFKGVGGRTHGQHDRNRAPGSLGGSSFPSRVLKGMKMAGKMGNERVKVINASILKVEKEKNLVIITGPVPGHLGSYVILEKN